MILPRIKLVSLIWNNLNENELLKRYLTKRYLRLCKWLKQLDSKLSDPNRFIIWRSRCCFHRFESYYSGKYNLELFLREISWGFQDDN